MQVRRGKQRVEGNSYPEEVHKTRVMTEILSSSNGLWRMVWGELSIVN